MLEQNKTPLVMVQFVSVVVGLIRAVLRFHSRLEEAVRTCDLIPGEGPPCARENPPAFSEQNDRYFGDVR